MKFVCIAKGSHIFFFQQNITVHFDNVVGIDYTSLRVNGIVRLTMKNRPLAFSLHCGGSQSVIHNPP